MSSIVSGSPPSSVERLFADGLPAEASNPLIIGRVLEEGEEADLRWLVSTVGEAELRGWLKARGGRQLSGRSRAFWALVLETPPGDEAEIGRELWDR